MSKTAEIIFEKLNIIKNIQKATIENLKLKKELTNFIDSI